MSDRDVVLLGAAENQAEADVWLALLEGEGIPCFARNNHGIWRIERGYFEYLYAGIQLYVPATALAAARQLLGIAEDAGPVTHESANTAMWVIALVVFAGAVMAGLVLIAVLQ